MILVKNQNVQTAICNHNKQCIQQTGGQFSFIPETDLKLYTGQPLHWETIPDIIQVHHIVKNSGLPNYLQCKIPINPTLNADNWRIHLDLISYLFEVLCHFQHCTGHITMGSWKGRGNQYIQFVWVLYCKLPTNSKQLPAFPLEAIATNIFLT